MSLDPPWLPALLDADDDLPDDLRAQILAAGADAVPTLLRLVEEAPAEHYAEPSLEPIAPVHAASLLSELNAAEAIEPMLRVLARDDESMLRDEIVDGLPAFGERAFAPTMAAFEHARDAVHRATLLDVLARLGVRDERVFDALIAQLADDPEAAAWALADYGDPRAVPALERAFDDYEPSPDEPFEYGETLLVIDEVIDTLGGTLSPERQLRLDDVLDAREAVARELVAVAPKTVVRETPKVGRNDPCPCGSGRKYKKCHGA